MPPHAKDVFSNAAIDLFDFATAKIISTAPVSAFSLGRLVGEHAGKVDASSQRAPSTTFSAHSAEEPEMSQQWGDDPQQGAECQAYLKIAQDVDRTRWWQASISSFFADNERSHYFCVLLIQPVETPSTQRLIPPEKGSHGSHLERPPLPRRESENAAIQGPVTLDDCVDDSTLALKMETDFYRTAVESMSEILFVSAVTGVVTYLKSV